MQNWKYLVEELELSEEDGQNGPPNANSPEEKMLEEKLNETGSGGWELVCLLPVKGSDSKLVAVYKQPVEPRY